MPSQCKPPVNRFQKMVPEGGFEPPTRGFSILLKARFSAAHIVNRAKNAANVIKYLANRSQTEMPRSAPNPLFCDDGGKLPKMGAGIRKLATVGCAIAAPEENFTGVENCDD